MFEFCPVETLKSELLPLHSPMTTLLQYQRRQQWQYGSIDYIAEPSLIILVPNADHYLLTLIW